MFLKDGHFAHRVSLAQFPNDNFSAVLLAKYGDLTRLNDIHAGSRLSLAADDLLVCILLLAAVCIPNLIPARVIVARNACVANLMQIKGAKATWALEEKKTVADTPGDADLFGATQYIRDKPECPANGVYTLNAVDSKPTCSLAAAPELHVLPGAP